MLGTTDRYATEVGLEVLRGGGNAVDAAVAVSFALAVVNPEAGNVGGGGFLVTRSSSGSVAALDYRSKAPGRATRNMFSTDGPSLGDRSVHGHLSAAVPGAVAGLWEAHRRLGSAPWDNLVEPAVVLARGLEVRERFTRSFPVHVVDGLRAFPESAKIFLPRPGTGERMPPKVGDTFTQPDLARTLERIRDGGADGFYRGETADLIVEEMRGGGGIITADDLEAYAAAWRDPIHFRHGDHTVLSMPLSSSGGATLSMACNMLGVLPLHDLTWHGPEHVHLLAETWRRAYADRNHYLADPDFAEVPVESLTSSEYGIERAGTISMERATPSTQVSPGEDLSDGRGPGGTGFHGRSDDGPGRGGHTTHVSIVDAMGGAVSLTTTLNTWYGSKLVVAGAGFLLNNEMDDFTVVPGVPNAFDLIQGEANAIEPGKRMLSAMTPTIVLTPQDELLMVVGTPGGATIITTVFQVVSNVLDFGMTLTEAVHAPRVHHQHLPDRIMFEPSGLTTEVVEALAALGHRLEVGEEAWGDAQAILADPDGSLEGVSDPRRGGLVLGF